MCRIAARTMTNAKSACRVGGGGSTCGSKSVSRSPKVRVAAAIAQLLEHELAAILLPIFRQAQELAGWHFDDGQTLPTLSDQRFISGTCDAEAAPETHPLHAIEPAIDHEAVAKFGRAAVVDLG